MVLSCNRKDSCILFDKNISDQSPNPINIYIMDSLVGYGSDDEVESDRYNHQPSVSNSGRRKEDDVNYDNVNMDLSEESQGGESEPELPQAEPQASAKSSREDRRGSNDSRERERDRERSPERRERRRERERHERERRSPRRDDRYYKDRAERCRGPEGSRRGTERLEPKVSVHSVQDIKGFEIKQAINMYFYQMPALMDLKPYNGDIPYDARDAASPRFVDRDRRDRDRERDRDRDSRHSRRSEERRGGRDRLSERSRSRGAAFPPPSSIINEKRGSPSSDYRPSSYKVNKKLEVMEKMGLQIKTPDGSMATAQQLRAAAGDAPHGLPSYCNTGAISSNKILDQVQKRKLLWSNKEKKVAEAEAAKWSGARFSQDSDGKQVSKFMRLMGIKDPSAVVTETVDATADPNKKQEELFQAMQAQYEVARATTHTMRGVGLGFQRGNF
ncbi:arginine/serine-rich coiled-coil protein 2-like [Vanessa cardui]|uniref:arginine/serine-rich coiled-coil protein 2-like n=1 Tax=Vanessa cardui TaxID=171605 RepID=UPI001F138D5C|nr:arginine/serine-rich coiled-coil protein 2-like [Vanessa cardui]